MRITEKEHKKLRKLIKPKETISKSKIIKTNDQQNIPIWFNKEQDLEATTQEEIEELDRILNDLV